MNLEFCNDPSKQKVNVSKLTFVTTINKYKIDFNKVNNISDLKLLLEFILSNVEFTENHKYYDKIKHLAVKS